MDIRVTRKSLQEEFSVNADKVRHMITRGGMKYFVDGELKLIERHSGLKEYYNGENNLHREGDLPAVVWPDTNKSKEYYKNGKRYREEGRPTAEDDKGYKAWHDEEGRKRVVIRRDGSELRFDEKGKKLSKEQINKEKKELEKAKEAGRNLYISLTPRPTGGFSK